MLLLHDLLEIFCSRLLVDHVLCENPEILFDFLEQWLAACTGTVVRGDFFCEVPSILLVVVAAIAFTIVLLEICWCAL